MGGAAGIGATIMAALALIFKIIGAKLDRDKDRKEKKKKAIKDVKTGIKDRDPAKITAGFDKLRRLKG